MAKIVAQNEVTRQFVVDFADDEIQGHGPKSIPVWSHNATDALPVTVDFLGKLARVGFTRIAFVEVA